MTLMAMLLRAYRRWKTYRHTYDELSALDDRTLADLNLQRGDIEYIARDSARQVA